MVTKLKTNTMANLLSLETSTQEQIELPVTNPPGLEIPRVHIHHI